MKRSGVSTRCYTERKLNTRKENENRASNTAGKKVKVGGKQNKITKRKNLGMKLKKRARNREK